jgi:hypothetical protein
MVKEINVNRKKKNNRKIRRDRARNHKRMLKNEAHTKKNIIKKTEIEQEPNPDKKQRRK